MKIDNENLEVENLKLNRRDFGKKAIAGLATAASVLAGSQRTTEAVGFIVPLAVALAPVALKMLTDFAGLGRHLETMTAFFKLQNRTLDAEKLAGAKQIMYRILGGAGQWYEFARVEERKAGAHVPHYQTVSRFVLQDRELSKLLAFPQWRVMFEGVLSFDAPNGTIGFNGALRDANGCGT